MQSKKSIYILLPVVLFIWGFIVYKFFSYTSDNEAEVLNPVHKTLLKPIKVPPRKEVTIDVNYRDPFLGKLYTNTGKAKRVYSKKRKPVAIPVATVQWPIIIYKGLVTDNKDKQKVFMLLINNRSYIMAEKQTEEEVTLIKGNRTEIYVEYKKLKNNIKLEP